MKKLHVTRWQSRYVFVTHNACGALISCSLVIVLADFARVISIYSFLGNVDFIGLELLVQ
jgi:hypothetical protein